MKRVGIFLRKYKSSSKADLLAVREDLIKYLRNFNVQVICIPIIFDDNLYDEFDKAIELINECDGIILPGGAHLDDIDLKITKYLYDEDIPTLGICLGMQIMALTFNGDIDHIGNETHCKSTGYVHEVKIKQNSKLLSILEDNKIQVNSRHHDYITTTDLTISAISNDLIIEGVEDKNKKFFVGVQWHPESLNDDIYSKRLFEAFINSL